MPPCPERVHQQIYSTRHQSQVRYTYIPQYDLDTSAQSRPSYFCILKMSCVVAPQKMCHVLSTYCTAKFGLRMLRHPLTPPSLSWPQLSVGTYIFALSSN